MNIIKLINNNKNQFDKKFKNLLKHNLDNTILSKAMFYGSINGGKRIRPFLVSQASKLTNIDKLTNKLNTFPIIIDGSMVYLDFKNRLLEVN